MAMAGESPSLSLKLLRLPSESIRAETRVPTAPVGAPVLASIAVSSGLTDESSVGAASRWFQASWRLALMGNDGAFGCSAFVSCQWLLPSAMRPRG